jgi:hypothetical protein
MVRPYFDVDLWSIAVRSNKWYFFGGMKAGLHPLGNDMVPHC